MQARKARRTRWNVFPYLAVLPAAALIILLMVLPIGETIYRSFTNWDGLTSSFIGIENFRLIFQNPVSNQVFVNSVIFLISVPLILAASVVIAVLVYERVLGWRVFRFLFFIPAVLSPVIVGALFSTFFLPSGLVDKMLSPVGLSTFPWLSSPVAGPGGGDPGPGLDVVRLRHGGGAVGDGHHRPGAL